MVHTIELRIAQNGIIVKDGDEETVFEIESDEDKEVDNFARFLWWMTETYGPSTSRYSAKRIYIEVRPGDKYDGES